MALINKTSIEINGKQYVLIADIGKTYANIYVEGFSQLINVDSLDGDGEHYSQDALDDIRLGKINAYMYKLLGKKVYSLEPAKSASWDKYPKSESISDFAIKKVGKKTSLGMVTFVV